MRFLVRALGFALLIAGGALGVAAVLARAIDGGPGAESLAALGQRLGGAGFGGAGRSVGAVLAPLGLDGPAARAAEAGLALPGWAVLPLLGLLLVLAAGRRRRGPFD